MYIKPKTIYILMATYNGAEYVSDQIDSIIAQNYSGWRLLIRDDDSSDASTEIIQNMDKRDSRITVLKDGQGRLGVNGNFHALLQSACKTGADYFLLSDQDDVWLPEKLEKQLQKMSELEKSSPDMPLLIHSDLEVVDQNMQGILTSFMRYQGIQHENSRLLDVLLTQNFVTGCTVMGNRKLLDIALPMPDEVVIHDWWLALCAATFGRIGYIETPLVKYRQHARNAVGAKSLLVFMNPAKTNWWKHWQSGRVYLLKSFEQAGALGKLIRKVEPDNINLEQVYTYASLPKMAVKKRMKVLASMEIRCQSWFRHQLMMSRMRFLSGRHDG